MDHAQRPHDGQAPLVLPNCHLLREAVPRAEGSHPAPPRLSAVLSHPHPTCLSLPVKLMGCHITCALRGTGASLPCPCAQTFLAGISGLSPALRGGGAGFPRLVLAGPPEAGCVLLACRGHSCKRPGCKTMWRPSWPRKEVQESLRQGRTSGTDQKGVSRVLAPRRVEEPDLDGSPQTRPLWGLPQLD